MLTRSTSPFCASRLNFPDASEMAPSVVPFTCTEAPVRGAPASSVTCPVTFSVWACTAEKKPHPSASSRTTILRHERDRFCTQLFFLYVYCMVEMFCKVISGLPLFFSRHRKQSGLWVPGRPGPGGCPG